MNIPNDLQKGSLCQAIVIVAMFKDISGACLLAVVLNQAALRCFIFDQKGVLDSTRVGLYL